jgi:hypothetical protein
MDPESWSGGSAHWFSNASKISWLFQVDIQGVDFENADSDMRKRLSDRMTEMAECGRRSREGRSRLRPGFSTIEREGRDGRRERL